MTVDERIKKIRIFRKIILDKFGATLSFEGKSISVRIAQYETGAPVAVTFKCELVNNFLLEWNETKNKSETGEITPNEYFEWKIMWPHT